MNAYLELGLKECPECSALNQPGAKYCDQCRAAFPAPEPSSPIAWRVVHKWSNHYAEDGTGADTPEAAVEAFNLSRGAEDMRTLAHLNYVVARLERTDDPLVFNVLAWRPLTPDLDAGEYILGDPLAKFPPTVAFSYLESAQR